MGELEREKSFQPYRAIGLRRPNPLWCCTGVRVSAKLSSHIASAFSRFACEVRRLRGHFRYLYLPSLRRVACDSPGEERFDPRAPPSSRKRTPIRSFVDEYHGILGRCAR